MLVREWSYKTGVLRAIDGRLDFWNRNGSKHHRAGFREVCAWSTLYADFCVTRHAILTMVKEKTAEMPNEGTPLLQTVPVAEHRERYPHHQVCFKRLFYQSYDRADYEASCGDTARSLSHRSQSLHFALYLWSLELEAKMMYLATRDSLSSSFLAPGYRINCGRSQKA